MDLVVNHTSDEVSQLDPVSACVYALKKPYACDFISTTGSHNRDPVEITQNAIGTSGVQESRVQTVPNVHQTTGDLFSKVNEYDLIEILAGVFIDRRAIPMSRFFSVAGPAWDYDEATDEYYLHLYLTKQPDLNWDNEEVREDVCKMMKFWLDRGCDGFRVS